MSGYGVKKGEIKSDPIVIDENNSIARGRFINRIEYRKSDKAEWLTIEIKDKEGKTARRSYFPPEKGSLYVPDQAAFDKEIEKFNRTIKNLTNVLLSPKYETGDVASFGEFCNKVITDIGKSYVDKELRVKLVYDSKNRPSLPNYPTMFEDPTIISDDMTKMSVTKYDKVKPSDVAMDSEKAESSIPSKSISADDIEIPTKKSVEDLPF